MHHNNISQVNKANHVDSKKILPIVNQNDFSSELNSDNQKIQDELVKIDKQLNDMKVLNANLLVDIIFIFYNLNNIL